MTNRIYTWYDPTPDAPPHQAELIRLWDRSWTARGFDTRLLTLRHAQEHQYYKPGRPNQWESAFIIRTHGACDAWFVPSYVINYSLTVSTVFADSKREKWGWKRGRFPTRLDFIYGRRFDEPAAWRTSELVIFPKHFSMDNILQCGRQLL